MLDPIMHQTLALITHGDDEPKDYLSAKKAIKDYKLAKEPKAYVPRA